jgi:2-C-methyl-D-erythritol 4-phosphate cytidylyltransferase
MQRSRDDGLLSKGCVVHVRALGAGSNRLSGLPLVKSWCTNTPTHSSQFWTVYERPILYYTLECIEAIDWIEEIIVPVAEDRMEWLEQQKKDVWRLHKTHFVVGGEARHQSIYEGACAGDCVRSCALWTQKNSACMWVRSGERIHRANARHRADPAAGLKALSVEGRTAPDIVIVHDAVRPFVDEKVLVVMRL